MFIPYRLADGSTVMVEVTEETAAYILESDREIENAERRERYHSPYSLDAMTYRRKTCPPGGRKGAPHNNCLIL